MQYKIRAKNRKRKIWASLSLLSLLVVLFLTGFIYAKGEHGQFLRTNVWLEKDAELDPLTPLVVNFSVPILNDWRGMNIKLIPEQKFSLQWQADGRQLKIVPASFWQPETKYILSITNAKSVFWQSTNKDFEFETVHYPVVTKFYPWQGEKDVLPSPEDPIFAAFDKSLEDFNVKFVFNPDSELVAELDETKSNVRILPKDKLEEGKKYDMDVYVKYKKETASMYHKIYTSSFESKKTILPQEAWSKDPVIKLAQAKENTKPKIVQGKFIDVNLTKQVLVRFENGKALDAALISSGKKGLETPMGSFSIHNKFPRVWSKKYALYMPYWMALVGSGAFGFHELPEWPGGYKEGANHLGIPVSHGCVRLGVGPAKMLYDWAEIGTPVEIHY